MSSAELHNIYDDYAPTYARNSTRNAFNAYYERPASLALVGDVTGLRVLDAGCGPGIHAEALIAGGAEVTGVDGSSGQLEQARLRLGPDVPLLHADLSKPLPLPDNAFDVVFSSLVLHYIEDWHPTLSEFHRVLVPGGRFVMSTHHPFMDHAIAANGDYFAQYLWDEQWGDVTMRFWHRPLHAITDAITKAGFQLDVLSEPMPRPEAEELFPREYAWLSAKPQFLFLVTHAR
jgi:ubiquinone/menaquinone biosynthesis C-methylase UbiE